MSSMGIQLLPQQLVPLMPILDAMSDGVLVVDASGSIIAVNKSMRRFYQGGETPFPGYPLADFNAADWVEAKRVLTSGKPLLGQTMHLPAATVVANRLPILQNGKVAGVVCAMQEISSLDAVVRQLGAYRELDSQLKGLLEALPQAVLVTDAEGRILRVNAPCCRLCAMERDSLQGRNVRELEKDFPELAVEVAHCLQRALPAQSIARCQGRPLLLWSVPSLDNHKKPRFVVVSLMDLERFDYVRQQLEDSRRSAEEAEAVAHGGDIFSQVTQEVGMVVRSAAIRRVVDRAIKVSQTDSSVLLQGESGVGKTHLIQAIGLRIKENMPATRVLYLSAHDFLVQYTDAVRNNRVNDFISFYQSIDVLLMDDIQEFAGKTQTQNTFFHIFNHLHQSNKQLVLTCDRPPVELVGMVSRLLTRFKWGLTAEVERPDYKLRYDILMSKVHRDGLSISEEVIDYIARNVTDNVRDLEGVIVSLMVRSSVLKKEISIEMADQVLAANVKMIQKQITIDSIKEAVCGYYGLDVSRLLERTRKREVVVARQMSMYLAKKYTSLSLAGIGDILGKKDHATVLHACKTISEQVGVDKKLRSDLEEIEQRIQG